MKKPNSDIKAARSSLDRRVSWQREPPVESGLWWWWGGDEDSLPIPIDIAYSGSDGSYFASIGQYGWNRPQTVTEMGGWWMRLYEPELPANARICCGEEEKL